MCEEIKNRLKRLAYNALLDDVMDMQDSGIDITLDEYIDDEKIIFEFDTVTSGSRLDAVMSVYSYGEQILFFKVNVAR